MFELPAWSTSGVVLGGEVLESPSLLARGISSAHAAA